MRKYGVFLVIAAILFSILFVNWFDESNNNPLDYARITEVDYKAVVVDELGGDGKIIVTERLTFEIHAASKSNLFWELWRDLSEEYIDGVKVEYQVNSVKQILEDGSAVVYEQSPRLYWEDEDFTDTYWGYGPGKYYHSKGPYNENQRRYECVFFYVDGLYRETVVFEIEYEMSNAVLRYNDCSELYITPYSEGDINYLKSFKGQILIPNAIMPKPGNYSAHTYGTNANEFPFTESASANPGYYTFAFDLDKSQLKFRPYNEYIEFSLVSHGEDKHIFSQYASSNYYYDDDVLAEINEEQAEYEAVPGKFNTIKIVVLLVSAGVALLVLLYAFGTHGKLKKRYIFYEPTMQFDYFRDIPSDLDPNFASTLVFCKRKPPKNAPDGYAAVLLSLVHKGYIELEKVSPERDWDYNNVKIVVKWNPAHYPLPPDVKPLTQTEDQYLNLILRYSNGYDLPMNAFQQKISADYENTNNFVKNTESAIINIGVSQGYFQKADYTQPAKQVKTRSTAFGVLGALIMIIGNIISYQTRLDLAFGAFFILGAGFILSAIYLRLSARKYVLLTQFGEDEYAKWRGLYNFLNSATLMNERTVIELPIWERYLIYATAFGISDKVIAAINIRCPYVETSPVLRNPYYRSVAFHASSRSFRSATRSATRASSRARSGGFGGHGGYGGGGRGGGGGGGGH